MQNYAKLCKIMQNYANHFITSCPLIKYKEYIYSITLK